MKTSDKATSAESVIDWLRTMKVSPTEYKMNETADASIFTSCFALFILDLFREVDKFTDEEKERWISHIQSFQDEKDGYFKPTTTRHEDPEHDLHQLTCFCLSALGILNAEHRFPLRFLERWQTPDDVQRYLSAQGCHEARPTSGNKAMFLGIFLTYEYERTREKKYLENINAWFDFHDNCQNSHGLWGKDRQSYYYHGLQNGLHQFMIYLYWNRPPRHLNRIIDTALAVQDRNGFFAPLPGGEACHDFDTIHSLIMGYRMSDYRREDIIISLSRAATALCANQNADGGFCQSKKTLLNYSDILRHIPFCLSGNNPYLWYFRFRKIVGILLRKEFAICTSWTREGRAWNESNLWDTWFRCLALAEIETIVPSQPDMGLRNARFHKTIGLGHFSSTRGDKGK